MLELKKTINQLTKLSVSIGTDPSQGALLAKAEVLAERFQHCSDEDFAKACSILGAEDLKLYGKKLPQDADFAEWMPRKLSPAELKKALESRRLGLMGQKTGFLVALNNRNNYSASGVPNGRAFADKCSGEFSELARALKVKFKCTDYLSLFLKLKEEMGKDVRDFKRRLQVLLEHLNPPKGELKIALEEQKKQLEVKNDFKKAEGGGKVVKLPLLKKM